MKRIFIGGITVIALCLCGYNSLQSTKCVDNDVQEVKTEVEVEVSEDKVEDVEYSKTDYNCDTKEKQGFLTGVAIALECSNGQIAYMGNDEELLNYFKDGIQYANDNYGSLVALSEDCIIAIEDINDLSLGQLETAKAYDRGVKYIYAPSGSYVAGIVEEAKARELNGTVVSEDLYDYGSYENGNVVLFDSDDIFGVSSLSDDTVTKLMETYDSINFK